MENGDVTLGEIHRTVKRIEATLAPLVTLGVRVDNAEQDILELRTDVKSVTAKATFVSGSIAGIGTVLNFLFGRH